MRREKRNTFHIAVILCCLVFGISACGAAEPDTASGTGRQSNMETAENAEAGAESVSGTGSEKETGETIMGQSEEGNMYLHSSTVGM